MPEVAITELLEIDPDRVDAVSSPANGTDWLILKAIDNSETVADVEGVLAEIDKATADNQCDACDGRGKMDDGSKCTKCRGTGLMPKVGMSEKELEEAAKEHGVAASGQPTDHATHCPTCKGTGSVPYGSASGAECPDCDGTGKDSDSPPADKLARVDADGHKIHVGDAKGREKVDKALDDTFCDDNECEVCKETFGDDLVEKKKLDAATRNALPDSAFALPGRRYPIHDENHARNALARVAQNGTPEEQSMVKAAVHRKFPNIGESDDASKAAGDSFSAPNPQLAAMATKVGNDDSGDNDTDPAAPGSPAWEAVDAQIAHDAALALKTASELIRRFAQREATEVAVGEGNDIFDTMEAESALCGVSHALGIMAQMAFHEGLEAAKSLDDADVVEKAGKRLSTKSVTALAAARDHISELLGADDPSKSDKNDKTSGKSAADKFIDSANKALSSKEIDNMTADELIKLLDERDAQKAAEVAEKGAPAEIVDAETDEVTDEIATDTTEDAAKAETDEVVPEVESSPEEIEAKKARKDAKKALKAAQEAEKKAVANAATAKAIEEAVTKATEAVDSLKEQLADARKETEDRLATVEKMAAPDDIVRTRPVDALHKSAEKDARDLEIAKFENLAKNTTELELRRGYLDRAKQLRADLVAEAKN